MSDATVPRYREDQLGIKPQCFGEWVVVLGKYHLIFLVERYSQNYGLLTASVKEYLYEETFSYVNV